MAETMNPQPAETCGRVLSVSGSQASVGLPATSIDPTSVVSVTVGKFLRIQRANSAADRHGHRSDARDLCGGRARKATARPRAST